jgi:putative flippase GtrA
MGPMRSKLVAVRDMRFARFLVIGVFNTIFGYGVFALVYLATGVPTLAIVLATGIGVLFNFMTTGRVVFGNRDARAIIPFVMGYAVTMAINIALVDAFLAAGINALAAQAFSLPIVVGASYLINAHLVFRAAG